MQPTYTLWLPSWYPSKLAPYEGDFIQRHAQAAALFTPIVVLFLVHDRAGKWTRKIKVETTEASNLTQLVVYYRTGIRAPKALLKAASFLARAYWYRKVLKRLFREKGLPQRVHLHVGGHACDAALWLRQRYRLPLLVSEHWGGFLERGKGGYNRLYFVQRWLIKETYKKAVGASAPSQSLAQNLNVLFGPIQCRVIPNVVDTALFTTAPKKSNGILRLIHISTLDYPKNVAAMIAGLGMFYKNTGTDFDLTIVGPPKKELAEWCAQHGIRAKVQWEGERPQAALVPLLQQSDALILFSHHETFGCVLIEANACGVPVLVSNVPVFREIVKNGFNGLMAPGKAAADLCQLLQQFVRQKETFDAAAIRRHTWDKYNFERAGRLFEAWYREVQNPYPPNH